MLRREGPLHVLAWFVAGALALLLVAVACIVAMNIGIDTSFLPRFS